jgi:hypothetical protein
VTAPVVLWLWLAGSVGLASGDDLSAALDRLGGADLVLMNDPRGPRPVRVLVATKVAAPADKLRQVLADSASYRKAMPAFRRTDIVSRRLGPSDGTDLEMSWELEVPAWNLSGKLWLRPEPQGVALELTEGDLAPGLFHLKAIPARPSPPRTLKKGEKAESAECSMLVIEGHANVRDANWAMRKLVARSPLVEPVMTVSAAYVMLKSLQGLAERGVHTRPSGIMSAPEISSLQVGETGRAANALASAPAVFAAVRRRADGRLGRIEVALSVAGAPEDASGKSLHPESFLAIPGWKKVTPMCGYPDECKDSAATCWAVETNLPFFAVGGTWKITPEPWRARMVAGDTQGAVLGLDFLPGQARGRTTLVMSQHPRMDQAGFVPRKLIEAEPFLEHGLALALTVVEAVSLVPVLEKM